MRGLGLLILAGCALDPAHDITAGTPGIDLAPPGSDGAPGSDGSATPGSDGAVAQGSCPAVTRQAMICIPQGDFVRGEPDGGTNELRTVTLSAYSIDDFEVTNADYKTCVTAGMCPAPQVATDFNDSTKIARPVGYVTWKSADRYCSFAGKQLPTAAQWEKAARGAAPDQRPFPWGSGTPDCQQSILNGCGGEQNVGAAPGDVSPFGVRDLGGSVMEWVFDSDTVATGSVDPVAFPSPAAFGRSLRGAAFDILAVPISAPNGFLTDSRFARVGFRCAHAELSTVTARFATAAFQVAAGGLVHFDGTTSSGATSYRWDFDGDGVFDTPFSSSPLSDQFYSTPGRFAVTLEAQGAGGSDRVSFSLLVTGNKIDGSPCDANSDCATGYQCSLETFAVCRKVCTQASQCDSTQSCRTTTVPTNDTNEPSGVGPYASLCLPKI